MPIAGRKKKITNPAFASAFLISSYPTQDFLRLFVSRLSSVQRSLPSRAKTKEMAIGKRKTQTYYVLSPFMNRVLSLLPARGRITTYCLDPQPTALLCDFLRSSSYRPCGISICAMIIMKYPVMKCWFRSLLGHMQQRFSTYVL